MEWIMRQRGHYEKRIKRGDPYPYRFGLIDKGVSGFWWWCVEINAKELVHGKELSLKDAKKEAEKHLLKDE